MTDVQDAPVFHPRQFADAKPDAPALTDASTGQSVSFGELERRANQMAHALRGAGLKPGDTIAIFARNRLDYFFPCWAAQRAGLYFVAVSTALTAPEVAYILQDSGAKLLVTDGGLAEIAGAAADEAGVALRWSLNPGTPGFEDALAHAASLPDTPIADEMAGTDMLYSSGTTGRPKGIRPVLEAGMPIDEDNALLQIARLLGGMDEDTRYLSPAPLYHAAPLRWCMAVSRLGGEVVILPKFDPEAFLRAVKTHRITHTQCVPTMFVRLLKLPEETRLRYDVSSLQFAIHAAAPCPVPVKEQMLDWWGPVIHEYYAGSEGNGMTWATPSDWLVHKGTVGKAVFGELHVCDEAGQPVPTGQEGQIYFSGTPAPSYHNAPEKSAGALNPADPAMSSLGDVGRVDEDGFLYLTDRKAFMIISGGVNIYPQEAENVLVTHPRVADVAVIGVPDPDFGEAVKAVIQLMSGEAPSDALAAELMEYCRSKLSKIKCPKSVEFTDELPRHATGKLYKRLLRDKYWGKESRIV